MREIYLLPDDDEPDTRWMAEGACGPDADAFFDTKRADEALAVCAGCKVRVECLGFALGNDEQFGVWGGLTPSQRARLG